jgi:hypothetical protein
MKEKLLYWNVREVVCRVDPFKSKGTYKHLATLPTDVQNIYKKGDLYEFSQSRQ